MDNPSPESQTILIVDDNEDDYEAIYRAFKKVGLNNPVIRCKTGREAMEILRHEGGFKETSKPLRPKMILLDLNMPGMDGRKVLHLIKEDAKLRRIPVIIWTTSSNSKDIEACYYSGANAYMQKPVTFEGIIESVRRLKEYWLETVLLPGEEE